MKTFGTQKKVYCVSSDKYVFEQIRQQTYEMPATQFPLVCTPKEGPRFSDNKIKKQYIFIGFNISLFRPII